MRALVKRAAYAVAPDTTLKILSIRSRRLIERQARELGLGDLARHIAASSDSRVRAGPFAGMRIDYDLLPVHMAPKYLGTYERELHDVVEQAISLQPPTVLNVGCEAGYYAVGLAMRLQGAHIYVADADPKAVRATMANGRINGVAHQMTPVGIVRPGGLSQYLRKGSLVVMDCEGAEFSLLNPRMDPILRSCTLIVEAHPQFGDPNHLARIFDATHDVQMIDPQPRTDPESDERADAKVWLFMLAH